MQLQVRRFVAGLLRESMPVSHARFAEGIVGGSGAGRLRAIFGKSRKPDNKKQRDAAAGCTRKPACSKPSNGRKHAAAQSASFRKKRSSPTKAPPRKVKKLAGGLRRTFGVSLRDRPSQAKKRKAKALQGPPKNAAGAHRRKSVKKARIMMPSLSARGKEDVKLLREDHRRIHPRPWEQKDKCSQCRFACFFQDWSRSAGRILDPRTGESKVFLTQRPAHQGSWGMGCVFCMWFSAKPGRNTDRRARGATKWVPCLNLRHEAPVKPQRF